MRNKWLIYTRGAIPLFRIELFIQGLFDYQKLNKDFEVKNIIFYNSGKKVWFGWKDGEIKKICRKIVKKCYDRSIIEYLDDWQKQAKEIINFSNEFLKINLKKSSQKDLLMLFDKIYAQSFGPLAVLNTYIDAIDIVFEKELIKSLKKELVGKLDDNEFLNFYRQISKPIFLSYVALEEKELLKIKLDLNNKNVQWLAINFWWTALGWEGLETKGIKYFSAKLKKIDKKQAKKRLNKMEKGLSKTRNLRGQLIEKYKLSNKIMFWLDLCDKFAVVHDLRKEIQMRTVYCFFIILTETAKRMGYNVLDLEYLAFQEIRIMLKSGIIERDKILDRKKSYAVLSSSRQIKYFNSKQSKVIFNQEISSQSVKTKELSGMSAGAQRNVTGKVKVCAGYKEAIRKIKKGDILVCGMTLPDYVPAMKLASGIITNEGGITCHAAILSRELDIPCIVGTKIATEVLKDGMFVEMDTKRGIVKII